MASIFTRLVSNTNDWILPSYHPWKKDYQGKPNIAYENQYGFGHEEWLFNPRYRIGEMQYGCIRGLMSFANKPELIPEVHLYTVQTNKGQKSVFYVGILFNVEPLPEDWMSDHPKVSKIISFKDDAISEVEIVGGDSNGLRKHPLLHNIRFRISDAKIFDTPVFLDDFPLYRYKRFQPYKMTKEIANLFKGAQMVLDTNKFSFEPGKARQATIYKRLLKGADKTVLRTHTNIVDALEMFLKPTYQIRLRNISIERTDFCGNTGDLVTIEPDKSISIYEVKTSPIARRNIKEAIAQLLDYASHTGHTVVNKLVIVAPNKLKSTDQEFLNNLRKRVKYKVEYLTYLEGGTPAFSSF